MSRKYKIETVQISLVTESLISEMKAVTEKWFNELRELDEKYLWSKDDIYKYLETKPIYGELVLHRDIESDKLVAWDLIELHRGTAILVVGHSAISGSFKYITYTLLKEAKKLKAEYANIGRTAIFKGKHILTDKFTINPTTVAQAKAYFPHHIQYTMYSIPDKTKVKPLTVQTLF